MIEYHLPFPPSVNNLFAGQGRRYPSVRYRKWQSTAGWRMRAQHVGQAPVPAAVEIVLTPPDRRARDADNYTKGIIDLAVTLGVLAGDSSSYVRSVTARWSDEPGEAGAVVRITPA